MVFLIGLTYHYSLACSQSINQSSQLIQQSVEQSAQQLVQQLAKQPIRQYLGDGEIYVETKYFNMIVPGWDILLTPAILTSLAWEPTLSNYLKERIKPGMITFDIGANMGWFSCLFASCGALVHAFEPNPRLQQILRKNIFLNAGRATNKCAVNQCAVSDNEGVVPMRFPHWLVGGASLHNYDQTSWLDSLIDEDINTDVVTLDAYAKKMNIEKVDLIKIDIEGFEEHALRGAADIISRSPGLILSIEFTRGQYSNSFPNWLFERFSEAYLPAFNRAIDLKFLLEYEAKTVLPEYSHIDIVFHARK
ncbi:MAG: FkbM family methyltransferase [Chloroflexi bacterium OLB14]|nr:MAG: FkbM family methyltransferase [Chloroflexi bacterium OLB14]